MLQVKMDPQFATLQVRFKLSERMITTEMMVAVDHMQDEIVKEAKNQAQRLIYNTPEPDSRARTHTLEKAIRKRPVVTFTKMVRGIAEVSREVISGGGYSHNGYYYAWIVEKGKKSGAGAEKYPVRPFWGIAEKRVLPAVRREAKLCAKLMNTKLARG